MWGVWDGLGGVGELGEVWGSHLASTGVVFHICFGEAHVD